MFKETRPKDARFQIPDSRFQMSREGRKPDSPGPNSSLTQQIEREEERRESKEDKPRKEKEEE